MGLASPEDVVDTFRTYADHQTLQRQDSVGRAQRRPYQRRPRPRSASRLPWTTTAKTQRRTPGLDSSVGFAPASHARGLGRNPFLRVLRPHGARSLV